jgi:transposase-like protein
MVYQQISPDMKKRALQLLEELSEIADALGVSTKSILRWHNNYRDRVHGRVDPPSALHGRHRILTGEVIDELRELIEP